MLACFARDTEAYVAEMRRTVEVVEWSFLRWILQQNLRPLFLPEAKREATERRREKLTPEIVRLTLEREPAKCIAARLGVSTRTVERLIRKARASGLLPR